LTLVETFIVCLTKVKANKIFLVVLFFDFVCGRYYFFTHSACSDFHNNPKKIKGVGVIIIWKRILLKTVLLLFLLETKRRISNLLNCVFSRFIDLVESKEQKEQKKRKKKK
jgi:hypothetical protein